MRQKKDQYLTPAQALERITGHWPYLRSAILKELSDEQTKAAIAEATNRTNAVDGIVFEYSDRIRSADHTENNPAADWPTAELFGLGIVAGFMLAHETADETEDAAPQDGAVVPIAQGLRTRVTQAWPYIAAMIAAVAFSLICAGPQVWRVFASLLALLIFAAPVWIVAMRYAHAHPQPRRTTATN